jgi:hypothetical protein
LRFVFLGFIFWVSFIITWVCFIFS